MADLLRVLVELPKPPPDYTLLTSLSQAAPLYAVGTDGNIRGMVVYNRKIDRWFIAIGGERAFNDQYSEKRDDLLTFGAAHGLEFFTSQVYRG